MNKRLRSALAVTLFLFTSSPLVQAESGVQPGEIQQLSAPTESPATSIPFAEIGAKATAEELQLVSVAQEGGRTPAGGQLNRLYRAQTVEA